MQNEQTYLTMDQAADEIEKMCGQRFSKDTISNWRKNGRYGQRLGCLLIGQRWYTTREALLAFFEASTHAAELEEADREIGKVKERYGGAPKKKVTEMRLRKHGVID